MSSPDGPQEPPGTATSSDRGGTPISTVERPEARRRRAPVALAIISLLATVAGCGSEPSAVAGSSQTSIERPDRRTISTIYADQPFTCGMEKFFPPGSDLYQRGPMQAVHAAPAETERALEIASSEKDLRQVLLPGKFRIGWSTVWYGNFEEGLGVSLTVEFDEPVQLSAERGLPVKDGESEGGWLTRADGLPQLEPVDDVGEEFSKARSARLLIDMDASLVYVVIPSFVNSFCEWPE